MKNETIDLTESIDTALFEGGLSKEYGTTLIKTNIFLRQQLKKIETACKDCAIHLAPEDYREPLDDGSVLCEDCLIKSEAAASADWELREGVIRS